MKKKLFFESLKIKLIDSNLLKYIKFTIFQLFKYNIQLGALKNFLLSTSIWFILGNRLKFSVINVNWTIFFLRKILVVVYGTLMSRKHFCLITDYSHVFSYLENNFGIFGESYFSGFWIGGSLTNYKYIWKTSWRLFNKVYKYSLNVLSIREYRLYKSLFGIKNFISLPGLVLINSIKRSIVASREARSLRIPTCSLLDSDTISYDDFYSLPSNDDSVPGFYFISQILLKSALLSKINNLVSLKKKKLFFFNKFKFKLYFLKSYKRYILLKLYFKFKFFLKKFNILKIRFAGFFFFLKKLKWHFRFFLWEIFKKYFFFKKKIFWKKKYYTFPFYKFNFKKNSKTSIVGKKLKFLKRKINRIFYKNKNFFFSNKKIKLYKKYNYINVKHMYRYIKNKNILEKTRNYFWERCYYIFRKHRFKNFWKRKKNFRRRRRIFLFKRLIIKGFWYNSNKKKFFKKICNIKLIPFNFGKKKINLNFYNNLYNKYLILKKEKNGIFKKLPIPLKKKYKMNLLRYKLLKFKFFVKKFLGKKIYYKYHYRNYNFIS